MKYSLRRQRNSDTSTTILVIRGSKVVLDRDLAKLYGVTVRHLNQAVKRNIERFPVDFMFQLTWDEVNFLRSQSVILEKNPPLRTRYRPHAFTEHGAVMAASLLNSPIAVKASIEVVRAFVRLRELVLTDATFRQKLEKIERKMDQHDAHFAAVFQAIRQLMTDPDDPPKSRIGYESEQ